MKNIKVKVVENFNKIEFEDEVNTYLKDNAIEIMDIKTDMSKMSGNFIYSAVITYRYFN